MNQGTNALWPHEIRALIFDLDDTLFPERLYVQSGFKYIANVMSIRYKLDSIEVFKELIADFDAGIRGKNFNRVLERNGINYNPSEINALVMEYRDHDPDIEIPKSTIKALDHMKKNGLKLGLITDGFLVAQKKKVETLCLKHYMSSIVYTDELGKDFWKPNIKPFKVICDSISEPPAFCAYIGDNPSKDFKGAKEFGMLTIQTLQWSCIDTSGLNEEYLPHGFVEDLNGVINIINMKKLK